MVEGAGSVVVGSVVVEGEGSVVMGSVVVEGTGSVVVGLAVVVVEVVVAVVALVVAMVVVAVDVVDRYMGFAKYDMYIIIQGCTLRTIWDGEGCLRLVHELLVQAYKMGLTTQEIFDP